MWRSCHAERKEMMHILLHLEADLCVSHHRRTNVWQCSCKMYKSCSWMMKGGGWRWSTRLEVPSGLSDTSVKLRFYWAGHLHPSSQAEGPCTPGRLRGLLFVKLCLCDVVPSEALYPPTDVPHRRSLLIQDHLEMQADLWESAGSILALVNDSEKFELSQRLLHVAGKYACNLVVLMVRDLHNEVLTVGWFMEQVGCRLIKHHTAANAL